MAERAFLEDYKGVVGFDVVNVGSAERINDLIKTVTERTDIYQSIRQIGRQLTALGWAPGNAGNISIREDIFHTPFFITASGSHFSNLSVDDIVYVRDTEIAVGNVTLLIGANREADGDFTLNRVIKALCKQGLFEQVKQGLGGQLPDSFDIDYPSKHMRLLQDGRRLISELKLEDICVQSPYCDGYIPETDEHLAHKPVVEECPLMDSNDSFNFRLRQSLEQRFNPAQMMELIKAATHKEITPEVLLTDKYIEVLRQRHNLTQEQVNSLKLARDLQNMPLYSLYTQGLDQQNSELVEAGFDLKKMVVYLNSHYVVDPAGNVVFVKDYDETSALLKKEGYKNFIRCTVYTIGTRKSSSETMIHALIYARRWDDDRANALIHCHAPLIVENPPEGMPVTETPQRIIGYGNLELALETVDALDGSDSVLLREHGPIAVSGSWQKGRLVCDYEKQPFIDRKRVLSFSVPILSSRGSGHYVIDSSVWPVFEEAFNVLKEKDRQAAFGQ